MVTNKSVLGADLAETIQADLAQAHKRVSRADRPLPGVAPMMALAGRDEELSQLESERDSLRASLKEHEGSRPTRLLDPNHVVLSRFANRHPDSYRDAEYIALRKEIAAAGGNTQPIGVRPLAGSPGRYELSFGSRRRQACLESGLPVLAMIEEMDDVALFERMDRENRQRKNLRPYEQGLLYQQALDQKIYASQRKMAEALQLDQSGLSRLLALARLDKEVVAAFLSPLDIQYNWGPALTEAYERHPDRVLVKARELAGASPRPGAKAVFEALVAAAVPAEHPRPRPAATTLRGPGKERAKVLFSEDRASITVAGLTAERRDALKKTIQEFFG